MNLHLAADRRRNFTRSEDPQDASYDREEMLLARILFSGPCLSAVAGVLEARHFEHSIFGEVYEAAREWFVENGSTPPVSFLIRAFEGTAGHAIAPTEWLLRLQSLGTQLTNPHEAREAARAVIDAWFRRIRCGLVTKSADEIDDLVSDYRRRTQQLTSDALSVSDILDSPEDVRDLNTVSPYVVKHLVPQCSTTAVHGPPGCGKTFWTIELARCVCAGDDYHGHRVRQGAVVYVCQEGRNDFPKRVAAAEKQLGPFGGNFAWLKKTVCLSSSPDNDCSEQLIITACDRLAKKTGQPTRLIIIDTLASVLAGDNENEAQAVAGLFARVERIKEKTGAAVLFVAHPGKDQSAGLRGSSALHAGLDAVIRIEREKGASQRQVLIEKSKDGPEGPLFDFTLKTLSLGIDGDGDEITSCVIEPCSSTCTKQRLRPAEGSPAAKALTELEHLVIDGKSTVIAHERVPATAQTVSRSAWRDACRAKGLTDEGGKEAERKAFTRAVQTLEKRSITASYGEHVWIVGGTSIPEVHDVE